MCSELGRDSWFYVHYVEFLCLHILCRDNYVDEITEESRWTALLMAVYLNLPLTVAKLLEHHAGKYWSIHF